MNIYEFKECNVVYAENQKEYLPFPVYKRLDGHLTSCWKLSIRERIKILFTGKMWLDILTFNQPLQPLKMSVDKPSDMFGTPETNIHIDPIGNLFHGD